MRKTLYSGRIKKILYSNFLFFCLIALCSCVYIKQFNAYAHNMDTGKRYFKKGDYKNAKIYFLAAKSELKYYLPLVYIAFIDYKTGRQADAEATIELAEKEMVPDEHNLRLLGYKALIFLNRDKEKGLRALKEYLDTYRHLYPLLSIEEVEEMLKSGNVELSRLEALIHEQVEFYEEGIDQLLNTGTGPFEGIYGIRGEL